MWKNIVEPDGSEMTTKHDSCALRAG